MCTTDRRGEKIRIRDEIIEYAHLDKIKDVPFGSSPDDPCVGDPTIWYFRHG